MARDSEDFAVDDGNGKSHDYDRGKDYEGEKIPMEPKDWETRGDFARARRVGADAEAVFREVQSRLYAKIAPEIPAAWGSEIAAVVAGRKPVFHEHFQEAGSEIAARLKPLTPPSVAVDEFDGHVVAYRPDVAEKIIRSDTTFYGNGSTKTVIREKFMANEGGELMGYGKRTFDATPQTVSVRFLVGGKIIAGFGAEDPSAVPFIEARAKDYGEFLDTEIEVIVEPLT